MWILNPTQTPWTPPPPAWQGWPGGLYDKVTLSLETSNAVASSSREMGGSFNTIAQSMETTVEHVNAVAASTEQMSITVNEISQNSNKAQEKLRNPPWTV